MLVVRLNMVRVVVAVPSVLCAMGVPNSVERRVPCRSPWRAGRTQRRDLMNSSRYIPGIRGASWTSISRPPACSMCACCLARSRAAPVPHSNGERRGKPTAADGLGSL